MFSERNDTGPEDRTAAAGKEGGGSRPVERVTKRKGGNEGRGSGKDTKAAEAHETSGLGVFKNKMKEWASGS